MEMIEGPVCHDYGIRGRGNPDEGVAIVGIAPGREEIKAGFPLVGPSGKLLDSVLREVGWPREKTYCTNIVCWQNNEPTLEEAQGCLPRLKRELHDIQPKLIVTLGRVPCEYLFMRDFTSTRGALLWSDEFNCYTISTYHPAAVLRGSSAFIHDMVRDLAKIPRSLTLSKNYSDVKFRVIESAEDAQQVLDSLSGYVSLDIETSNVDVDAIDVFEDRLLCFGISDGENTYVFPEKYTKGLDWTIAKANCKFIFHNGMFDTQGMKRYLDVDLPIDEDTMLMSYSLDERKKKGLHSLKSLAREYCASGFYEENTKKFRKGKLDKVPDSMLWEYNAKDAAYTLRLFNVLRPMQQLDCVISPYENILIPVANAFNDIQLRGAYIDQVKLDVLEREWVPRYVLEERSLQDFADSLGYPGRINLRSTQQLSHMLFNILRLPGGPSTARAVLDQIDHPFVSRLQEFRRLGKMLSTYVIGVRDDIKRDGRVHPNLLLHGTETGRVSYTNPPVQTIPKDVTVGEDYGRVKQIFSATNDDYILLEADYEKAEVWGAYAHSQDPQLLQDLLSGDYHTQVAAAIFHKKRSEVTKADRQRAKSVTFGIMYGRQAVSLATRELDCPISDAQHYIDNWYARYPKYKEWFDETRRVAQEEGEVVALTGRKRRFVLMLDNIYDLLNEAVNFPIQNLASDINLLSSVDLHYNLAKYDSYVLFPVHDSILFEVRKKNLETVAMIVRDTMSRPERFPGVPGIPVELKAGKNWGEMREYTFD